MPVFPQRTTALALSVCIAAATPMAGFAQAPVSFVLSQKAGPANHPTATSPNLPSGMPTSSSILSGGGARVEWTGNGSLLTETALFKAPNGEVYWRASAKDHMAADPAAIEAYGTYLYLPPHEWESYRATATGAVASHPVATATLPPGYTMTGGGCTSNWKTSSGAAGNLLTASFPANANTWECRAKDHGVASPASLTAHVIGIRPRAGANVVPPVMLITRERSDVSSHPTALAPGLTPPGPSGSGVTGYIVSGGGALAQAATAGAPGQLLTATYPETQPYAPLGGNPLYVPRGWRANSKDHAYASPGTVDAFAINLRFATDATMALGWPTLSTPPFISSTVPSVSSTPPTPTPTASPAPGRSQPAFGGKQPTGGAVPTPYTPPQGPSPLLLTAQTLNMYVQLKWEPMPDKRDYAVFRQAGGRAPVRITPPGFLGNEVFDAVEFPNETLRYSVAVYYPDGTEGGAQVEPRTPFRARNPASLSVMRTATNLSGMSDVRFVWPQTYGAIAYRIDGGRLPTTGVTVPGGTFNAPGAWTSAQPGTFTHTISGAAWRGAETYTIVAIYPHGHADYNARTTATLPLRL